MIIQATNQIGSVPAPDTSPPEQAASIDQTANQVSSNTNSQIDPQTDAQNVSQNASQTSENQLSDALKKVGIKAEIDFSNKGYTIVRYIDPESNQVVLQIPNQTVIALVANLSQVFHESDPAAAGAMIDQRA